MENLDYKKLEKTIARGVAFGILRFFGIILLAYFAIMIFVFIVANIFYRGEDKCIRVGNMIECPNPHSHNQIKFL